MSHVVYELRVSKDGRTMDMHVFVSQAILVRQNGTALLLVRNVRVRLLVSTRIIVVRILNVRQRVLLALNVPAWKVLLALLERTSARHVWKTLVMALTVVLAHFVARVPQAMGTSVCVMKHILAQSHRTNTRRAQSVLVQILDLRIVVRMLSVRIRVSE